MVPKKRLFIIIGISFWTLTLVFAILPVWPHIYYRLFPKTSTVLATNIAATAAKAEVAMPKTSEPPIVNPVAPTVTLPDINPALPQDNGLIIDKIGVRGIIHEGTDWQNILRTGIWRVPDFGAPPGDTRPIILASHRWGYLDWSAAFRKLNSFYSLPKLKAGDKIKIDWDQREYSYTVYAVATGTEITDYKANLILYTCQLWNSPVRFFVYANRDQI